MADEPKGPVLPLPPDVFTIPSALIEQWGEIPHNERLNVPLTRQDIDHLLVGLLRALEAQISLESTLIEWSNGRVEDANRIIVEFKRQNIDAQNNIRQLTAAIMASVLRERKHV